MLLLVADIGNTHVHLGLYEGERLLHRGRFPGERVVDFDPEWEAFAREALTGGRSERDIGAAIACSVSPKTKIPLMHWFGKRFGARPLVVGEQVDYPMPVLIDDPREVGADRVVNAYAAWRLCGAGPLVVCDFGTAITLDVVSAEGAYLGGVIAPGVQTAARALATQTALLPYVKVRPADRAIGRNTMDAIMSGLYFGVRGMVEAMCAAVAAELGGSPRFIATGGDAELIADGSRWLTEVRHDLTLDGLRLIYEVHRAASGGGT